MSRQTMRALIYEGPRLMNMGQRPIPEPGDDEVLIRVSRAGICGSELSGFLGNNSLRKPPLVMGHEFSGTIESTGGRTSRLKKGDRVTANPLITCGECQECNRGKQQLCSKRMLLGAHLPGAFGEYVAVPEKNVYLLPDHVSYDEGTFVEPFACAIHACRLLKLSSEERLLITGAGPIGLLALQAAQIYGLKDIVITDVNSQRLEVAKELGGIGVADAEMLESMKGEGFDAAIDAVGLGITRIQCMTSLRVGGSVVFSGLHENESRLPINLAIRNEISMLGAFAYSPYDFELALRWIGEGRLKLLPWTHYSPIEKGRDCFETLIRGAGKTVKILLTLE